MLCHTPLEEALGDEDVQDYVYLGGKHLIAVAGRRHACRYPDDRAPLAV